MELLRGVEGRVVRGERQLDEEQEIGREEIRRAVARLKVGKAMGKDCIPNEVWKFGGQELEEWVKKICNRVWRRGGQRILKRE